MLALLHILTIKSDFICVKLHKTFFFWKNSRHNKAKNIDNQNITSCKLMQPRTHGYSTIWFCIYRIKTEWEVFHWNEARSAEVLNFNERPTMHEVFMLFIYLSQPFSIVLWRLWLWDEIRLNMRIKHALMWLSMGSISFRVPQAKEQILLYKFLAQASLMVGSASPRAPNDKYSTQS
jgi:hypothetical protein